MFRMYDWKPYNASAGITDEEPKMVFSDSSGVAVLTLSSSGLLFNRDVFVNDSYTQAAKRAFAVLDSAISETLAINKSFSLRLRKWNHIPPREITFFASGEINHNYDLDNWHWWFLESLSKLIKEKQHTYKH